VLLYFTFQWTIKGKGTESLICVVLYLSAAQLLRRSGMARVNKESHTVLPATHVYPQV